MIRVQAWCTLSIRDSLRGAGGTLALLPFLTMGNAQRVVDAIHLIAAFCDAHQANQNEFVRLGGTRMIVCAIESLPAEVGF